MIREGRIVGKCAPRSECEPNLLHPAIVVVWHGWACASESEPNLLHPAIVVVWHGWACASESEPTLLLPRNLE
jgi:hypothetical protein